MSVAEGAIRSGKTIDHCIIAASYLETCPDKIHLASGSTMGNAKLNIGDCNGYGLEHLFRGRCHWGKYKDNEALFLDTQTGQKVIIFVGGGQADSYKRILGNSYGLWIATEINEHFDSDDSRRSFIKVAFGRQIAAKKPMILWDLNPCNPAHPIYENYIDLYKTQYLGGYNYEHFTIADNLSISEERKKEIYAQYVVGSVWYRRDIEGERCIAEGLVYPMYEDAIEEPYTGVCTDYVVSLDYGTSNAFAGILWGFDGTVWHGLKEYYWSGRETGVQKTDDEYLTDLKVFLDGIDDPLMIIDPSAASMKTLLRRADFRVREANNDVSNGISETALCLQRKSIRISRDMKNWFKEISGYVWDVTKTDDRPVKERDHLMDAMRYFVKTMRVATRRD